MAILFALHEIQGRSGTVEARTVADFDEADLPSLEAAGAVREATPAELALYRLTHPEAAPAAVEPVAVEPAKKVSRAPKPPVVAESAPADQAEEL